MKSRADRTARVMGLCIGLTLALVAVTGWRVPRGTGSLGADLIVSAARTGELAVTPSGPFLSATGMHPGPEAEAVSGDLSVFNQTGSTLAVDIRALPSSEDLDQMLMVEIESGGRPLFRGPLGGLRDWTEGSIRLASAETATITIRAWLAAGVGPGWEGRMVQVPLEFRAAVEA